MFKPAVYKTFIFISLMFVISFYSHGGVTLPNLEINKVKGQQCVEPAHTMRRKHMEFLKHQREETMRKGIRTKRYSLKNCISCHATQNKNGQHYPVTDSRHFCKACHEYAGVALDCFSCHATKPAD